MDELWRLADERTETFGAQALDYHRYRPRYPTGLFDDVVELGALAPGMVAIDVGAGTGIATAPLVARGLDVTAVEPSTAMAEVGRHELGERARWVVGRFEDLDADEPVDLVFAANSWHWVEPRPGVELAASLLRPGGSIALVWTPVVSWGGEAFERSLADAFGAPWPTAHEEVMEARRTVEHDPRFSAFVERRHRFERTLDAEAFVAVTRTYGGPHGAERDAVLARLVDEAGGSVTKVEEAVLFLARRC